MTVKIECLDVQPERDVYRGNGETSTELWIVPDERRCGVTQWREDYCNGDQWRGTVIQFTITPDDEPNTTPDARPLRDYLESEQGQELLDRICNGWTWDTPHCALDDDAVAAINELTHHIIEEIPSTEWSVLDLDEWFNGETGVDGTETDSRIREMADEFESMVNDEQIIDGDIYDYLIERRDNLRAKLEAELEDE